MEKMRKKTLLMQVTLRFGTVCCGRDWMVIVYGENVRNCGRRSVTDILVLILIYLINHYFGKPAIMPLLQWACVVCTFCYKLQMHARQADQKNWIKLDRTTRLLSSPHVYVLSRVQKVEAAAEECCHYLSGNYCEHLGAKRIYKYSFSRR